MYSNLKKERNRRNIGVFLLVVLLAVLAYVSFWKNKEVTAVSVPLPAPAVLQKAAEPAKPERASAPERQSVASQIEATIVEQEAAQAAQQSVETRMHTVKGGQTLIGIAKIEGLDWRELCVQNNLGGSCDDIRPGLVLNLIITDEVKAKVKTISAKYFLPKYRYTFVDCTKTKLGYCVFSRPGGDKICGKDQIQILQRDFGLTKEEAQRWSAAKKERKFIPAGSFIDGLSFGHGYWKGRVLVKQDMWYEEGVIGEKAFGQFDLCCNFFPTTVTPLPADEPLPAPVVAEVVPPVAAESPPLVVTEEKPQPEKSVLCPLDPKLVIGQEHEPKHSGDQAHSTFLSAAVYCTWRGEKGTHGVGAGVQASWWNGTVNNGAGTFKGSLIAAGPGYEYISDDSWDMEAKLLFGTLDESFKQGDYESSRRFGVAGPSLGYNNYQRRMNGEKWFPETQVHGTLLFPFSKDASHSWQGKPIEDTSELSKFNAYFNAGVRQWIYDGEVLQPYVQLGYFLESPSAESMSFRIGVSDPNRICGIGIGIDHDLKSGGNAKAWGWWCDVMKGVKVLRKNHRADQVVEETGNGVTVVSGIIMVPLPKETQ